MPNTDLSKQENKLPTLKELLYSVDMMTDPELAFKNDEFQATLNYQPPKKWIQVHPFIKDWKYIPIGIIEILLKKVFKNGFKWELLNTKQMFNGVVVEMRLHYYHPVLKEWLFMDGVGAESLQLNKGSLPSDILNLKHGSLTMGIGVAKATAKMNAAKELGTLFGANLNREISLPYNLDEGLEKAAMSKETKRKFDMIENCGNLKALDGYKQFCDNDELLEAWRIKFDELKHIDDNGK